MMAILSYVHLEGSYCGFALLYLTFRLIKLESTGYVMRTPYGHAPQRLVQEAERAESLSKRIISGNER